MKRTKTADPEIVVYPNGTHYFVRGRKEWSLKTKDYKEAVRKKRLLEPSLAGLLRVDLKLTFGEVAPEYLEMRRDELARGKIRARTELESRELMRLHLVPFFGKLRMARLDSIAWEDFKEHCKLSDLSNVRKVMSHFMKFAKKRGFAADVPILTIDQVKRRKRRILKPTEMRLIWEHSNGSIRIFIGMALLMGMRRMEIMTMAWDRVNFEERFLFVPESIAKTKRDRYIPLNEEVANLLRGRRADQIVAKKPSKWVFPHSKDWRKPADPDGLKKAWATVLRRAFKVPKSEKRPDITFHDLRATCETWAHKRTDLTPTQLEKFFGANIDVQRRIYTHFDADDVRGVETSVPLLENHSK